VIEKANTASESMNDGGFASGGCAAMPMMLKFLIIIKKEPGNEK